MDATERRARNLIEDSRVALADNYVDRGYTEVEARELSGVNDAIPYLGPDRRRYDLGPGSAEPPVLTDRRAAPRG